MKKTFLSLFALLLIWACATNPMTGRKSLALVSNSELFAQAFTQYDDVLKESKVVTNTTHAKMIQNVGSKLKYAAEKFYTQIGKADALQGYEWQFSLIESEEVNAWCMPGGKVAFYTGIMPVCKDETGVAVVMGHEIAHALAGHSAEQVSQAILAQGLGTAIGGSISNQTLSTVFSELYPIGSQLSLLRYGRKMELDADEAGLYLMAMAGFDPREAANFWERMESASSGNSTPEFLSTHPSSTNRISEINAHLPKALEYYNASPYKK